MPFHAVSARAASSQQHREELGMSERERTIIRVAGLSIHAGGFVALVAALLLGAPALGAVGVLAFVVGGAWGWGMVAAGARREAEDRAAANARDQYAQRAGFSARFDDEPEPAPVHPTIPPPPGGP